MMSLPAGSSLPLPPTLDSLEGVPGRFRSLEELSHGRDLLVLVASSESSMSDRLRQTLVGLQEVAPQHGVQLAAVTMVGAATYRKLARKTSVSYPLLSDPSRAWLGLLGAGAPAAGGSSSTSWRCRPQRYSPSLPTRVVCRSFWRR